MGEYDFFDDQYNYDDLFDSDDFDELMDAFEVELDADLTESQSLFEDYSEDVHNL